MSARPSYAVAADAIFDGEAVLCDSAVIVAEDRIGGVIPRRALAPDLPVQSLPPGAWLAPGFIDVQVNGGGDVLFNDEPAPQAIATIAAAHRRFGTTAFLPTLISDSDAKMRAARAAVEIAMTAEPAVAGLHFEGPFLSPDKRGVHDAARIRAPAPEDLALLAPLSAGVVLVTLAPERVPQGFIGALCRTGVRVALGHSMATYERTVAAMAEGLTGFTHLFNAMRPLSARDPGPIAAALDTPTCWYGLIADGEHVAAPVLRLALRGLGQSMLVTDAMPPVGGHISRFSLCGQEIRVRDGRPVTSDGTLAGSVLDMASAVRNCVRIAGTTLPQALRMASRAPAEFLGLNDRLGRLLPGYRADMVALLPDDVRVLGTWVAGTFAPS